MAKRTAAFQVLRDKPLKLKKKGDTKFEVDFDRISGSYALLAYKIWTNGKPMRYEADIVDYHAAPDRVTRIVYGEAAISNKIPAAWWEAFSANAARVGDDVRFRVTAGTGAVYISDVVLWVMRN